MKQTHPSPVAREGFLWLPYLLAALLIASFGLTCGDMQVFDSSLTSQITNANKNTDPNNPNNGDNGGNANDTNTNNPNNGGTDPNNTPNPACNGLTYAGSIASKINTRCGGCHSGSQPPNLSDYNRVVNNKAAILRVLSPQCSGSKCMRIHAASDANTMITWLQDCNAKQN